jgi:hypothetical protein
MEEPFANLDINEDQELLSLMELNPNMTYVKGYRNVFCPKNQDDKNIIRERIVHKVVSNELYEYHFS